MSVGDYADGDSGCCFIFYFYFFRDNIQDEHESYLQPFVFRRGWWDQNSPPPCLALCLPLVLSVRDALAALVVNPFVLKAALDGS